LPSGLLIIDRNDASRFNISNEYRNLFDYPETDGDIAAFANSSSITYTPTYRYKKGRAISDPAPFFSPTARGGLRSAD
jgi:hypothetical protein